MCSYRVRQKIFLEIPRKSRTRGNETVTNLSKKSYIRSPRKVTLVPIGIPSRKRKPAIDFFAVVTTGF